MRSCLLPPAPDQYPLPGQESQTGFDTCQSDYAPPNICYAVPGLYYKLRPDEAIVRIGQTPPPAVYFSFSTGNPQGTAFGVDNDQDAFIGLRVYVNHKTEVASAMYDVIWSNAILFTKRKSPHALPE